MTESLVSIILPTFNRKKFVVEAIKSVLSQTHNNFELIIIDDGSTDSTKDVVLNQFFDNRIRFFSQENKGVSNARNFGLSVSSGEYITFLDSDDLYIPAKIEKQLYVFNHLNFYGLCHSWYEKFDHNLGSLGIRKVNFFQGHIYPELLFYWKHAMAMPSVMIPRKIYEEIGGFEVSLTHYEDYDWWRRISMKYPLHLICEPLVRIRKHSSNLSSEKNVIIPAAQKFLEIAFSQDKSITPNQRKRALGLMYGHAGRIYLGTHSDGEMPELRRNSYKALKYYPFQIFPIFVIFLSFFNINTRTKLKEIRRNILYK